MEDELGSKQKTDEPPIKYSSKVLQEFKENLPRSVVPVVLTILGAVAFQSAVALFDYYSEGGQISQQARYERERDIRLEKNTGMIWQAVLQTSSNKHLKLIEEFQEALPAVNPVKREQFAERFRDAIDESNRSLGTLEGYSGVESTLPQNVLNSEIELSSADLESLQVSLACTEQSLETIAIKIGCIQSMRKQSARVGRALARV